MNNKSVIVKLIGLLIAFFAAIMVNEMFGVTAFLLILAGYAGVAVIAYGIFLERTQINYNMLENDEENKNVKLNR